VIIAAGAVSLALVNTHKECIFEVLRNSSLLSDLTDLVSATFCTVSQKQDTTQPPTIISTIVARFQ